MSTKNCMKGIFILCYIYFSYDLLVHDVKQLKNIKLIVVVKRILNLFFWKIKGFRFHSNI